VTPGFPALEITLTSKEQHQLGSICIEINCPHLGVSGCTLGPEKPFSCHLYPLVYNPMEKTFHYDTDCPVMPTYIKQLKVPGSEAQSHLQAIKVSINHLESQDPEFLINNFEIDQSYFEIKKLPYQNKIGNT
jgi:Fe-S-cluster containining protein